MAEWGQGRYAFPTHEEATAQGEKDRASLSAERSYTPLELTRMALGQKGIRFDGNMQVADLSHLEAFIREVVRDEMNQPIPVVGGHPVRRR